MVTSTVILGCMAFSAWSSAGEGVPPAGWKELSGGYKKQAYALWLPNDGKVSDRDDSIMSKYGQIKVYRTTCQRRDGPLLAASQIILPPQLVRERPKVRQDFFRDMCLDEFNGTLKEEKNAMLGTMAGKEYLIQTPKGMVRYQVFGTGVQIFRVLFVGTKEQLESKDAETFFASFKRTQQLASGTPAPPTPPVPGAPPGPGTKSPTATSGQERFQVPTLGDLVMLADGRILVLSVPTAGQLIYYDTVADKQVKKVDVEFQPAAIALKGKNLFVAAKGTATLHVLDAESGKEIRELKVPGEPIKNLACHPNQGLLYAANEGLDIYAIDPDANTITKTKASGQEIVVDPVDGKTVYTSVFKSTSDRLLVQELPGGKSISIKLLKGAIATFSSNIRCRASS